MGLTALHALIGLIGFNLGGLLIYVYVNRPFSKK